MERLSSRRGIRGRDMARVYRRCRREENKISQWRVVTVRRNSRLLQYLILWRLKRRYIHVLDARF